MPWKRIDEVVLDNFTYLVSDRLGAYLLRCDRGRFFNSEYVPREMTGITHVYLFEQSDIPGYCEHEFAARYISETEVDRDSIVCVKCHKKLNEIRSGK